MTIPGLGQRGAKALLKTKGLTSRLTASSSHRSGLGKQINKFHWVLQWLLDSF
jgi:hypothetical protein